MCGIFSILSNNKIDNEKKKMYITEFKKLNIEDLIIQNIELK